MARTAQDVKRKNRRRNRADATREVFIAVTLTREPTLGQYDGFVDAVERQAVEWFGKESYVGLISGPIPGTESREKRR